MRYMLISVILFCCVPAIAEDYELIKQLEGSDLDAAAQLFSQKIQNGDREDWEQLHRYFVHDPERYRLVLERVDSLPWKDSQGRRLRSSERVIQFNGSHDRFIHCLNRSEFNAYVDAYLSVTRPSAESLIHKIESRHTVVPGANGDDGACFGDRRLAMALIERLFPELSTSYNRKTFAFARYGPDAEQEIKRIAAYLRSVEQKMGEPSDEPNSR